MPQATFAGRWNLDAIESAYIRWLEDPASVDESWRVFFEGFELGPGRRQVPTQEAGAQNKHHSADRCLPGAGAFLTRVDPLADPPASIPLLELSEFGLDESDLDRRFDTSYFLGMKRGTLWELLNLRAV